MTLEERIAAIEKAIKSQEPKGLEQRVTVLEQQVQTFNALLNVLSTDLRASIETRRQLQDKIELLAMRARRKGK